VVKRAASDCLAKYGIHKANADFKEIWGFVYRGTEFALVRLSPRPWMMEDAESPAVAVEDANAVTCYRESCGGKVCQSARRDVREENDTRRV
jgi:hypothetical protein